MREDSSWLAAATKSILQDLDTSKKELELVRDVLDNYETNSTTSEASGSRFEDRTFCMRACQEYSGSRVHMLEERIRQIHVWSSDRKMGKEIPDGVPDEWSTVDIEWRQWLSEQTSLQTSTPNNRQIDPFQAGGVDMAVRSWGPLIPLLEIYTR
ncbi:uncharacterized protein GGS22DRAFT_193547 [Annulohypoxylon maeteangense]|uniref:uncharacterized protein n=1 Tax=Annulohypoxylon maeteangense TaxID=1927788 RepID=UPI002008AF91|nr:uncharacterized protein GGS22DRAFT_193547 [Annulohypoxylon maeteangense]KAI0880198.1 hypothetical protein GGS22DRAFT_193547 [Annulohypoxylon maeteangense]